ncbi:MAG: DEAD/DEAH box helicase [Chloroflexota bacterium]|nr:DEAD/DEAH box helicase [Chloroflexota bacterium]
MSFESDPSIFIASLREHPTYKSQIVHVQRIQPRRPLHGELAEPLNPPLQSALESASMFPLYSHQAQAINAARAGRNVFIVTPSASGKTLGYNVPVLERMLSGKRSRALYLFPTKALAQDQLRGLGELIDLLTPSTIASKDCTTFDGDTAREERRDIKKSARVVLSNPDMLHVGILPNHESWSGFLRHLSYVVVDEAHIYRGVFGSNVANVLRRLRRLCELYGSSPQFICCSATIANPREHIENLVGLDFDVVDEDGSPYGGKDFVFWNPPLVDREGGEARRSANTESSSLLAELAKAGLRTIDFAKSRKLTELIYIYSRDRLREESPRLAERIMPYRAGYIAEERRFIERQLFDGGLLGIVSTNAMELGVDIGDLDATVLTGYPGSISSAWQQAGRSGRRGGRSLSFLIAMDDPLDQYFMRHPEAFFGRSFESALINQSNSHILRQHLLCAAWERPLDERDADVFGPKYAEVRDEIESEGLLRNRQRKWYLSPQISYPAEMVNIRSASADRYTVVDVSDNHRDIETVDASVAFFQLHQGAIYLHQGESYLVGELDIPSRTAYAKPVDADYYTQVREIEDLSIQHVIRKKEVGGVGVCLGGVTVTNHVISYRKRRQFSEEVIGEEPLDLPQTIFPTIAFWFGLPHGTGRRLAEQGLDLAGGLHAVEHAAIGLLPLFALCDRNDIGGVSTPAHADTGKPQIFIYDAYPGGVGIAERGYEFIDDLWKATLQLVKECPCESGCPACVQSPKCGNYNEPLDKRAAVVILEGLVGGR